MKTKNSAKRNCGGDYASKHNCLKPSIGNSTYHAVISGYTAGQRLIESPGVYSGGVVYNFDYFQIGEGVHFKVFNRDNICEYKKFLLYPDKRISVIDVEDYGNDIMPVGSGSERMLIVDGELGQYIEKDRFTLAYYDGQLWPMIDKIKDDITMWHSLGVADETDEEELAD